MATIARVFRRAIGATAGSRSWSEVAYVVERQVGPDLVEFRRFSSKDEAFADADEDGPSRTRWELDTDDGDDERRGWRL